MITPTGCASLLRNACAGQGTMPSQRDLMIRIAKQWLTTAAAIDRLLWRYCFDRYRPELHYMRGPGPRCRQKHGRIDGPALTNRGVVSVHRSVGADEACPKAELPRSVTALKTTSDMTSKR